MADKRKFWQTKTFWGTLALFLAGGLEAIKLGDWANILQQVCAVIGIPLTVYGVADRLRG